MHGRAGVLGLSLVGLEFLYLLDMLIYLGPDLVRVDKVAMKFGRLVSCLSFERRGSSSALLRQGPLIVLGVGREQSESHLGSTVLVSTIVIN